MTIELVVQRLIGGAIAASEREGLPATERRRLVKLAVARVEALESFVEDDTVSVERRVRTLVKALEIGLWEPAPRSVAAHKARDLNAICVRTGP